MSDPNMNDPGAPIPFPPPPPEPLDERPVRRGRRTLVALAAAVLLTGSGIGIGFGIAGGGSSSTTAIRTVPGNSRTEGGLNVAAISRAVDPAVVDINTVLGSYGFGPTGRAAGTGMVLTSSGEVLTNNHVIQGATGITVTIPGRSGMYQARVLGAAPSADVALLQVEGVSGLQTVTLADSSSLTVGQEVVAIGNALGQGGTPTVTAGTITALDRSIVARSDLGSPERLTGLIQTDASISPGDSGGPLVNNAGQVVGMITAGASGTSARSTTDVGFAVPSNAAVAVADQITAGHGSSSIIIGEPGFLGVQVRNLDAGLAARLGLRTTSGALVVGVVPGTPAATAGITRFAVITAIDGAAISSADALGPALHQHEVGQVVRVTWVDSNGTHTASVRLVGGPAV